MSGSKSVSWESFVTASLTRAFHSGGFVAECLATKSLASIAVPSAESTQDGVPCAAAFTPVTRHRFGKPDSTVARPQALPILRLSRDTAVPVLAHDARIRRVDESMPPSAFEASFAN